MTRNQYYCCICHKEIKRHFRLCKQEFGIGKYKQYYPVNNYDFCDSCYAIFEKWLNKHRKGE